MNISLLSAYFILYSNVLSLPINETINYEELLINKLFNGYNKELKPWGTIQIKLSMNLNQIIKLIEKEQIIVLNAFIDHEWIDTRLIWNPLDYNNISIVRIRAYRIWTPDTFIYTTADNNGFLLPQFESYFVINHNGNVFWPQPITELKSRCKMNILWFPYDIQKCEFIFGSWSYTMNYLNYSLLINQQHELLKHFQENNEWILLEYKGIRREIKYDNWIENDELFSEIRYKLILKRKPLFVITNCMLPAIMLTILTLISFYIPFAQEMQLGISIMLSYSVYAIRLSEHVPIQSDFVPLIMFYFILCMLASLKAMIWFSFKNILKETLSMPKWLKYLIINYVSKIYCKKNAELRKLIKTNESKTAKVEQIDVWIPMSHLQQKKNINKLMVLKMIDILNEFIFNLFLAYALLLNTILLIICPLIKLNHENDD